jgi:hypothetical protein
LDLEHPGEYAKMTVDSLAVRGLRFYLLGVLDRLPDQVDPVLDLAVERYEPKRLLLSLADNFDQSLRRLPSRLAQRLVQGKAEVELRLRLISGVRHRLGRQELDQ